MEPLAARVRPKNLKEYVGQAHLVGLGKPLRVAIEEKHVFSFVLWGPPGVGKTTLAKIYAAAIGADFHDLSAVSAGKDEVRKIIEQVRLRNSPFLKGGAPTQVGAGDLFKTPLLKKGEKIPSPPRSKSGRVLPIPPLEKGVGGFHKKGESRTDSPTVLFLDEIHRFNKAQQDYLLPFVESGELVLIGATTENPSFEIISPLLSRLRVFVLESLSAEEVSTILRRTDVKIPEGALDWLVQMANGDARQALTVLENASELYGKITLETLREAVQSKFLRYDKKGEEHYNIISAFIKSMRAGDANAAIYYLARMVDAGEDPKFIARRMVIFASEDVGLAQPTALVVANEVFRAVETIGYPECAINLAHGVAYLAHCPKNRSAYDALRAAQADVKDLGNLPVPLRLRNAPTKLMKDLDYGKSYEKYSSESCLPDEIKGKKYLKEK